MSVVRISCAIALWGLVQGCSEDPGTGANPPAECAAPMIECGPSCINRLTDPANCGTCGHACATSELCSAGACTNSCTAGLTACGRSCVNFQSDAAHCGRCDRACGAGSSCVQGNCVMQGTGGGSNTGGASGSGGSPNAGGTPSMGGTPNSGGTPNTGGAPSTGARITVSGTEFRMCGQRIWMNGANTPWDAWDDFGGAYNANWWSNHYQDLHDAGLNSSRVWITCSGTVGIQIDSGGTVSGASAEHWADLDSFFALAQQRQIYVMATLMSFDHFEQDAASRWAAWIASDQKIDSYVNTYLVPFLDRYGDNPYLWAIDLINEPDWVYENSNISFDRLRAYFARAARAIHENSEVLVTIGMAMPKYNATCSGCTQSITDAQLRQSVNDPEVYLDFYSPHYYDWMEESWGNTLHGTPAATDFPTGKPLMFGEHPANGTSGYTLIQDLEAAFANGWQGAMPWTSNGVDANGGFSEVSAAATAFRNAHSALVFPACQ